MLRFVDAIRVSAACAALAAATATAAPAHTFDLAAQMPPHLAVMFSMSWFGIPKSDPQGAGPDPSYGNGSYSNSCSGAQADEASCDACILKGAGDVCLQMGAPQRSFASRRRPLAGVYSASARDAEGRARVDLMLSTLRRPCDDGARLDAWTVQLDGTRDTSLHAGNQQATSADIAYRALAGFFAAADAQKLAGVVMPGDDATWYFHFGKDVGLGACDDSAGNPKQNCIDALAGDVVDMVTMAAAHPSALRIGGKLVVFVYVDQAYLTAAEWQSILDGARAQTGRDFYAIAAVQNVSRADYFAAFDALAPWVQLAWNDGAGSDVRSRARAWAGTLHDTLYAALGSYPGRVVFGGVAPGFDDFTEDWGQCKERQLPPGDPRDPAFLDGEFDYLRGKSARGLILETWDDWTEGTEFEPDVAGGTSALVHLRDNLGALYGDGDDAAGDARLEARWSGYGQARNCSGAPATAPPAIALACPAVSDGGTASDGSAGDDGADGGMIADGADGGAQEAPAPLAMHGGCAYGGDAGASSALALALVALTLAWRGRRRLAVALVAMLALAAGCHGRAAATPPPPMIVAPDGGELADAGADDLGDAAAGDLAAAPPDLADDSAYAADRAACKFTAGALPKDTFGPSVTATQIPIDTFVLVVHENRAFDHYFSSLPAAGQPDADVAAPNATIPAPNNGTVARFHQPKLCIDDTNHSWNGMHSDWDGGKNDGFAKVNAITADPTGARTVGYYDESDLPFYYGVATTFAISDRYFSPTLTSTGPNRLYLYAATSNGSITNNGSAGIPVAKTIFGEMTKAGVTWKVYSVGSYSFEGSIFSELPTDCPSCFGSMTDFANDAAAGKLPNVVFTYPGSDEHPPADVQLGEHDSANIYATLATSPQWGRLALFYTYDEDGGQYDHVPPPKACAPDAVPPALTAGDVAGDFARYGFRVPMIVVSAWARAHYVSHVVNDHTSLLRLIELRFGLPALTARDANANGLLDLFDFAKPSFPKAPAMPTAPIDATRKC